MGHVRVVLEFFNAHPKQFAVLKEQVIVDKPASNRDRLINVCCTRWYKIYSSFSANYLRISRDKDNVDGTWNAASVVDASSLYHST